MKRLAAICIFLSICLLGISQNRYGFRIAYENNGLAIGSTDQIFNGIKLNLIDKDYYQVRGINISAANISSAARNDNRNIIWGANIGLIGIRGRNFGLSVFPLGNFQDEVRGVSFGVLNSGYMRSGLSLSVGWTKAIDKGIYGVTGSAGVIKAKSIKGFAFAPLIYGLYHDYKYYRMEMRGCAISMMIYSNYLDGTSISLVNINKLAHGVNIGMVNVSEKMTGLQIGIVNASDTLLTDDTYLDPENMYKIARRVRPLAQIGVVNSSQQRFTSQYGLFNWSEEKYCIQFGLINVNMANRKGLRVLPFVNWQFSPDDEAKKERDKLREDNRIEKQFERERRKQVREYKKQQRKLEKEMILDKQYR